MLERERRSDVDDSVALPGHLPVFVGTGAEVRAAGFQIAKELLHSSGRCESDEESTRSVADEGECMRHTSWAQYRIAWYQLMALIADLDDVFACEAVEPLIFLEMEVFRRPAFLAARLLGQEERASGVLSRDFDEERASIRKSQGPAESISPAANLDANAGPIGCLLLRQDTRRKGGHCPKERSTSNAPAHGTLRFRDAI